MVEIADLHPGDSIQVTLKDGVVDGLFMPSPEGKEDVLFIKLDSGYNKGILVSHVTGITLLEKHVETSTAEAAVSQNSVLPTVAILHTGGTIASKVDYATGGVVARFTPAELMHMFPEIKQHANIRSRLLGNMSSEDMRFEHYNLMAEGVKEEITAGVAGVIITHGTDTMHCTAAALQFMLRDLPVPVVLVGAQRSSDRGSSDAKVNLLSALRFITETDWCGVGVCMHESMGDDSCVVLQGFHARKMHTSRRDAFRPINNSFAARVTSHSLDVLQADYVKRDTNRKLHIMPFNPALKIGLLKPHVHMYAEEVLSYVGFDGLLIEGTGLGHFPISVTDEFTKEHAKIFKALQSLISDGTIIATAPQAIYGRLQMNVYSPGRRLQQIRVLGQGNTMTSETSFVKLAWLLSNFEKHEVPELFMKNMYGELTERLPATAFLN